MLPFQTLRLQTNCVLVATLRARDKGTQTRLSNSDPTQREKSQHNIQSSVPTMPAENGPPISNGDAPADTLEMLQAFLEAARYGDIDDVKDLVSQGVLLNSQDTQGRTALHMAAANGHLDVVQYLINQGADLNACNIEENTPLHWAALNGHAQVVHEMILAGANAAVLNRYDRTPLDEALSRNKMDVVHSINAATAALELNVTHLN